MWQLLLGLGAAQFFQHPGTTSLRGTPAQVLMPQGTAGQLVVVAPQQVTVPHHADSGSFQGAWMALCAAAPVAALAYFFASPSASPTPAPARTMPRSFAKRSMPVQMQMAGKKSCGAVCSGASRISRVGGLNQANNKRHEHRFSILHKLR